MTDRSYVMTDIVGSTPLWDREPAQMAMAMVLHDQALQSAVQRYDGHVLSDHGEGDSAVVVFSSAAHAVAASLDVQRALTSTAWPTSEPVGVRMAVHTGPSTEHGQTHLGPTLNRCARIRSLADRGQVLLSAATAALVAGALPEGASVEPLGDVALKGLDRPELIHQLLHPDLSSARAALHRPLGPTNLPPEPAPIGRDDVLSTIAEALHAPGQVVVLVGPGGVGKTTLAVAAGHRTRGDYPKGVWFVDLRPLPSDGDVLAAVAAVLQVDDLQGALDQRLLVIDNTEHVRGIGEAVSSLLALSTEVQLLTTSRSRGAEQRTIVVPPLPLDEGIALLRARAERARPDLLLSPDDPVVSGLVATLDGLPLAIELAAARLRVLSPADLLERLQISTDVLDARTAERTLRATLQWSWDLLTPALQRLLARLSLFSAPVPLAAVQKVCGEDADLLDDLQELADNSLLVVEDRDGVATFRLLVPVRQFAQEKLSDDDPAPDRHLAWLIDMIDACAQLPEQDRERQQTPYLGDVGRALDRALVPEGDEERTEQGIQLALKAQGHVRHRAGEHLVPLLHRAADLVRAPGVRGSLLCTLGLARLWANDAPGAEALLRLALEDCTPENAPTLYYYLGHVELRRDFDRALEWYAKAGEAAAAVGNVRVESWAHNNIGLVHGQRGEQIAALACYQQAERVATGHPEALRQLLTAQLNVAHAEYSLGRRRFSSEQMRECAKTAERTGQLDAIIQAGMNLAIAAADEGDVAEAAAHAERTLALVAEDVHPQLSEALVLLASVRLLQHRDAEAKALLDRAEALDPDPEVTAQLALCRAELARKQGNTDAVRRLAEANDRPTVGTRHRFDLWCQLALALLADNDLPEAVQALDRAAACASALEALSSQAVLEIGAGIAAAAGNWVLAAQLSEASERQLAWTPHPTQRALQGRDVSEEARKELGDAAYADAIAAVRQLTQPQELLALLSGRSGTT